MVRLNFSKKVRNDFKNKKLLLAALFLVLVFTSSTITALVMNSQKDKVIIAHPNTPTPKITTVTPNNPQEAATMPSQNQGMIKPNATQKNCTKTNIVPYKTIYSNAPYLTTGQSQTSGGSDGFTLLCPVPPPNDVNVFQPIDKTVYIGTGPTSEQIQAAEDAQQQLNAEQQQLEAENARNERISSCIQYVKAASGGQASYDFCYNIQ